MNAQVAFAFETNFDFDWNQTPTALEAAHYDALLKQGNDAEARRQEASQALSRSIFGECLLGLTQLGVSEAKARPMLGKWRGKAKNDELLIRVIKQAIRISSPDPISYITRALAGAGDRQAGVDARAKGSWELLGWEKPRMTAKGPTWRGPERGQVWRDPFGAIKVLPAKEGTSIPGLDLDPGVETNSS